MPLFKAVVQYDGTEYCGFQIQAGERTIQGELERILGKVTQDTIRIVGAGRTDSGVHARGQVISFETGWVHTPDELLTACNANLPPDIALQSAEPAPIGFDARRSAFARTYRYVINNRTVRTPLRDRSAWHVRRQLEAPAMHAAIQGYIGVHDFAAFGNPPKPGKSTAREMLAARCWRELDWITIELTANAFLQGMVRRIVGALVMLGSGHLSSAEFANLLHARNKQLVKWKAPPQGLCLWAVEYIKELQ
jgi:tRNA pseudouridine38-40 synthase